MTLALALLTPAFAQPTPVPVVPVPDLEVPETPATPDVPTAEPVGEVLPVPELQEIKHEIKTLIDQRVVLRDSVNDVFAMGQDVTLQGTVDDNAFVMAQSLDVSGPVNGDLMAMGERVIIDDVVLGDVYAMGAYVEIKPGASVAGSVTVAAGELVVGGPVAGDLNAGAGRVVIASPVAGNVELEVGEVAVEPGGSIAGDLDYTSAERSPSLEAIVAGDVDHTKEIVEIEVEIEEEIEEEEGSILGAIVWWGGMRGWGFVTKLLVGLVLLFVGGERMAAVGRRVASHPGQSLGVGFIVACVLPVASMAALMTIVPFPLGLLGFTVFGILLYVAQIFAAQAIGDALLKQIRPDAVGSPYLSLAVGLMPLILLCAIPWLGNLAWLGATLAGMGALWAIVRGAD